MRFTFLLDVLAAAVCLSQFAPAQNLGTVRVATGLVRPTAAVSPDGDYQRLFITEQYSGKIRILKNGTLLATNYLNIQSKLVAAPKYDQGLLGLVFHPNYISNGIFFVAYTDVNGKPVIERYNRSQSNPDQANPSSGVIILGPLPVLQEDHSGGCMRFGPDGKLYIATGDGGSTNPASSLNGQDGTTLLGKMLRLDIDLPAPYIPVDNPYVSDPLVLDEIWDIGLRHPWQFSFDRVFGDLYISDVGNNTREEINVEEWPSTGMKNYGWRCMEGLSCSGLSGCTCNDPSLTLPVTDYTHSFGCSVIGGFVYRGCAVPGLDGQYIYGDFCSKKVYTFFYDRNTDTIGPIIERTSALVPPAGQGTIGTFSTFGEDAFGEIYICDYSDGEIFKIVSTDPLVDCNANTVADACDISRGTSLDVNANGIPDECECPPRVTYCTAKVNSMACVPSIASSGTPSATALSGFTLSATSELNNKVGLVLYSEFGRDASAFGPGGLLCVKAPTRRSKGFNAGGNPSPPTDCSGVFSIDFNTFAQGGLGTPPNPAPYLLIPGQVVTAQFWGRDPGFPAPDNFSLSNALEFTLCP